MVNLDDPGIYKKLDPGNMLGQLYDLPQQCLSAWRKAIDFKLPPDYSDIDKVVVLGMGGSAIGGDLTRSLCSALGRPVIFVSRDYDLPPFVDDRTLVVASSYSGNTEETLSAFSQALNVKSQKLIITTGGKLKEMAAAAGIPVFVIDHVSPPRAALGYGFIPLMAFLLNLGFLKGIPIDVPSMAQNLEKMRETLKETVPAISNSAKQLAAKLHGKIAVIYGAGIISEVARRWKTQINENSKSWAFYETLPELNHNAVVGYQFPSELTSKVYVLLLRCPSLHPRTLVRYRITGEMLEQNGIGYQIVDSQGEDAFNQIMSLVFLGDWVSYYLGILYQIDPSPVKVIDYLKKQLSETK
jgi:glucose/mannose-6-phosphate isomerase